MAANSEAMGALHDAVATVLAVALKGTELPGYTDEDGKEHPPTIMGPSAAIIQAATKFLKDNEITCVAAKDNALGELEAQMETRRQKRDKLRADRLDKITASEQRNFTDGLH